VNIINISKQNIFDIKRNLYATELLFHDSTNQEIGLSNNAKETAQLIISSLSNQELNKLLHQRGLAFISVDETSLLKNILDVLDKDRFIINILDTIDLNKKVMNKIIQYKKRGFKISIEGFDSSAEMIKKFHVLFNFIDIIKMDITLSEPENLQKVVKKFKETRIKLLAQNIETKEDYKKTIEMGFHFFQGYYLDKPELIEIVGTKEAAQYVILQLIKILKENDTTEKLEYFIKQQPDLSYRLVQFFNNSKSLNIQVESITQVITLMGRDKLLRWLMVYLYSEVSTNPTSHTILELAVKRAQRMEHEANGDNKEKAYLAGMFSMLSSIFDTDTKELIQHVNMDPDITSLIVNKKGIFATSLRKAEEAEKKFLKKVMLDNFEKIKTTELINAIEDSGVIIEKIHEIDLFDDSKNN
jgi:c-di-GMP phosphodiesterase